MLEKRGILKTSEHLFLYQFISISPLQEATFLLFNLPALGFHLFTLPSLLKGRSSQRYDVDVTMRGDL